MILSFKKKFPWGKSTLFKEKILSGTKIHSIRVDKNGRWKAGRLIHTVYGARTKFYECFCDKHRCKSKQEIAIKYKTDENENKFVEILIDGKVYTECSIYGFTKKNYLKAMALAENDGFDSVDDFFRWFNKDTEPNTFIIHWTDFRY